MLRSWLGVWPILDMDEARLERLQRKKHFIWLKRHLKPSEAQAISALEHEGIQLKMSLDDLSNKELAGALIGFSGIDGRGLEGLEKPRCVSSRSSYEVMQ